MFVVSFGVFVCVCVSLFSGLVVLGVHMHYKSVLFVYLGVLFHCVSGCQDVRVLCVYGCLLFVFGVWLVFCVLSCVSSLGFSVKEFVLVLGLVLVVLSDVLCVFVVIVFVCLVVYVSVVCVMVVGHSGVSVVYVFCVSGGVVVCVVVLSFVVLFRVFEFVVSCVCS